MQKEGWARYDNDQDVKGLFSRDMRHEYVTVESTPWGPTSRLTVTVVLMWSRYI